jgi:2'-5' RNA ligase
LSPDQPARLRLFVAVQLPPAWKRYLASQTTALEHVAPGYTRWVAPDLLHLTLVFLGWQPSESLQAIAIATGQAAAAERPFVLALGRLGHFGGAAARVLWLGVHDTDGQMAHLHAALATELLAQAVVFDARPFVPHLTLGRARRRASSAAGRTLASRLRDWPTTPGPPAAFTVERLILMRSELLPGGPRYTALGEYPLRA